MSIATAPKNRIADYVTSLASHSPQEAVQIALAEAERERSIAERAREEYRAMAEVEFDQHGRITHANMGGLWRLAQMYSGSATVPEQFRGKPNDCFIACQMAFRLKVDPLAFMQASYVVHGRPGMEAKLAIALLNTSGAIKGRVKFKNEGEGKDRKCTAYAIDADTGETVEATVDWKMVEAEGWAKKSGSKWQTMPDVMFPYRAAVFLIRRYYPEVLMGIQTVDELEDIDTHRIVGRQEPIRSLEKLTDKMLTNGNGADPEEPGEVLEPGETMDANGEIHGSEPEPPESYLGLCSILEQKDTLDAVNKLEPEAVEQYGAEWGEALVAKFRLACEEKRAAIGSKSKKVDGYKP